MKLNHPADYGYNGETVKTPPETITGQMAKASGKAKARYPHPPLSPMQTKSDSGKLKRPAYTPGTSPDGS